MGLILKKVAIEDYIEKDILFSKQVRGNLDFYIETHHLEGGKHLQLFFYRNHPRVKEFIAANDKKNHLTKPDVLDLIDYLNKKLTSKIANFFANILHFFIKKGDFL